MMSTHSFLCSAGFCTIRWACAIETPLSFGAASWAGSEVLEAPNRNTPPRADSILGTSQQVVDCVMILSLSNNFAFQATSQYTSNQRDAAVNPATLGCRF